MGPGVTTRQTGPIVGFQDDQIRRPGNALVSKLRIKPSVEDAHHLIPLNQSSLPSRNVIGFSDSSAPALNDPSNAVPLSQAIRTRFQDGNTYGNWIGYQLTGDIHDAANIPIEHQLRPFMQQPAGIELSDAARRDEPKVRALFSRINLVAA